MDAQQLIKDNLLVRMLAGSHAYGTNLPTSDVDYRGLFFAPQKFIRTPFFNMTEVSDTTEEDTKYYEISQFLKLYTLANPNILELLYTDQSKIELTSDPYELLRANADKLLSKKVAFTFSGYAIAQLKRIKGHNKWINNAQPVEAPRQIDYVTLVQNFTDDKLFKLEFEKYRENWILLPYGGEIYGMYDGDPAKGYTSYNADYSLNPFKPEQVASNPFMTEDGKFRKSPKFLVKFNKEHYKQDHETWKNYWNWRRPKDAKAKLFKRLEQEIIQRQLTRGS